MKLAAIIFGMMASVIGIITDVDKFWIVGIVVVWMGILKD